MSDKAHQHYIKEVHLKGFKSIRDTEVSLREGLNILIGPNGSGKSNFLDFLYLQKSYGEISKKTSTKIKFQNESEGTLIRETSNIKFDQKNNIPYQDVEESLSILGQESFKRSLKIGNKKPIEQYLDIDLIFNFTKLSFGFPEKTIGLTETLSFIISFQFNSSKVISIESPGINLISDQQSIPLFDRLIYSLCQRTIRKFDLKTLSVSTENLTSPELFSSYTDIISNLKKYTPIQGLKFDDSLRLGSSINDKSAAYNIDYLRLAFKVENDWLTWDKLSDGTKRLFYLVFILSQDQPLNKYLIEEPELGVHPDQLFKLMDFIKEKSETNQIIITTHSPQVLNILNEDELDRIIITKYTKISGTKMRHLSEEEIKNAKSVMSDEGLFLSDYWVHLNLEEGIKW